MFSDNKKVKRMLYNHDNLYVDLFESLILINNDHLAYEISNSMSVIVYDSHMT